MAHIGKKIMEDIRNKSWIFNKLKGKYILLMQNVGSISVDWSGFRI